MTTIQRHPLSDVALSFFDEKNPAHDRISLASRMAGSTNGKTVRAYKAVAEDVLALLQLQGEVKKDPLGWYRKV